MDTNALLTLPDHGITLVPYARGLYSPDLLYHLWRMMDEEGILARVLYQQAASRETRIELAEWIAYFDSAIVLLAYDEKALLGAVWWTEVTPYRGNIGVAYRQRARGELATAITSQACAFAFAAYGWTHIWGLTPWRGAVAHGLACGFTLQAVLPAFLRVYGRPSPCYVLCKEDQRCRALRVNLGSVM